MLSHKIIVYKEAYRPPTNLPVVSNVGPPKNRSFITSQEILDTFLLKQPKEGDYVYRSLMSNGTDQIELNDKQMLTKVVEVVTKFEDLTFDYSTGFPQTHKLVTLFRGHMNPWIRMENITNFSLVPQSFLDKWLDAELQNYFKTAISKSC